MDPRYALSALATATTAAEVANADVETKRIPYQDPTSDRAALVKTIGPLTTQTLAHVKSNTVWLKRHEAVKKAADKVRGVRPPPKKAVDPEPDKSGKAANAALWKSPDFSNPSSSGWRGLATISRRTARSPSIHSPTCGRVWMASTRPASQVLADAITGPTAALKFVFNGVRTSWKGQSGRH